jgi:hypothetical protein
VPNPIEHPAVDTAIWCQLVEAEDPTELRLIRKRAVEAASRPRRFLSRPILTRASRIGGCQPTLAFVLFLVNPNLNPRMMHRGGEPFFKPIGRIPS